MRIALKVAIALYWFVGLLLILGGPNYALLSGYSKVS